MKLFNYQKIAIDYLHENGGGALFIWTGLGKTLPVLLYLEDLKWKDELGPTLVIAPIHVVEGVWPEEIKKWNIDLSYAVCRGKPKDRIRAIKSNHDVLIINFETLNWFLQLQESKRYKTFVIDELDRLKSTKTQMWRKMRTRVKSADIVIGMTGTPASESLIDLYGTMTLISRGKAWKNKTDFLSKHFVNVSRSDYPIWRLIEGADKRIHRAIAPYSLSLHEKDYSDLPELTIRDIWLDLPRDLEKYYRELENDFFTEIDGDKIGDADSVSSARMKMRQLLSGFIYNDDGEAVCINNHKGYAFRETLWDLGDEHVLIPYQFVQERETIIESVHATYINPKNTKQVQRDWNKGKIKYLTGHPKSMGDGINIQYGGRIVLWYSLPWSYRQFMQTNARLRRNGQPYPVTAIRLLYRNTIDEAIVDSHVEKNRTQDGVYDAIDRYRKRLKSNRRRSRR